MTADKVIFQLHGSLNLQCLLRVMCFQSIDRLLSMYLVHETHWCTVWTKSCVKTCFDQCILNRTRHGCRLIQVENALIQVGSIRSVIKAKCLQTAKRVLLVSARYL